VGLWGFSKEAGMTINTLTICGSLRQGSLNRALIKALPGLAPAGMTFAEAPPYRSFPLFDADFQAGSGIPADVVALGTRFVPPTASPSSLRSTTGPSRMAAALWTDATSGRARPDRLAFFGSTSSLLHRNRLILLINGRIRPQ
jgi:hypothetical protein